MALFFLSDNYHECQDVSEEQRIVRSNYCCFSSELSAFFEQRINLEKHRANGNDDYHSLFELCPVIKKFNNLSLFLILNERYYSQACTQECIRI